MRLTPLFFASALSAALLLPTSLRAQANSPTSSVLDPDRIIAHQSSDWKLIEPHLPDLATATPAALEQQADLLRVRRFPADALDYYDYALNRGGNQAVLLNKIGVTQLEMGNSIIAKQYFKRVVKMRRNDSQGWNNLGAVQFLENNYVDSLRSYKRAVKYNRRSAVYHSNLGLAYIQTKDFESAKSELTKALKLDPEIFQHESSSGASLHMLSTADRASFCFQMAKVYARMGNEPEMLHSLETAAEAGLDVQTLMYADSDLAKFARDQRVVKLVMVAKSFREGRTSHTTVAVALPPAAPVTPAR